MKNDFNQNSMINYKGNQLINKCKVLNHLHILQQSYLGSVRMTIIFSPLFFSFFLVSFSFSLSIVCVQRVLMTVASHLFHFLFLSPFVSRTGKIKNNMKKGEFRQSQLEAIITHKPSVKRLILFTFYSQLVIVVFLQTCLAHQH